MADNHSKVIPLRPNQNRVGGDSLPLIKVKQRGKDFLKSCFQSVFDVVDDTFFDLADRAENQNQQTAYFDAMRTIRLERKAIENQLLIEVDERFASVHTQQSVGRDSKQDNPDGLELVEEEHLEEMIALDTMVSRCLQNSPAIDNFNGLLTTLFNHPITTQINPFGPEIVCDIFGAGIKKLDIDIRSKLVFYKLFERYVLNDLNQFYIEATELLKELGVVASGAKKPQPISKSFPTESKTNLREKQKSKAGLAGHGVLINRLTKLLKTSEDTSSQSESVPKEASLDDLVEQISDIQAGMQGSVGASGHIFLTELLENQLAKRVGQTPVALGNEDRTVVHVVDEVLNYFGPQSAISEGFEPLVQSLKLPILSIALKDPAFFDKDKHPARRLLNEVAQLSMQFDAGTLDTEDSLYKLIDNLVKTLTASEDVDTPALTLLFANFLEKVGAYERRIHTLEQRLLEETQAQEQINQAHTHVSQLLADLLEGRIVPRAVVDVAEQGWSKLLFLAFLKSGVKSEQWQDDIDTINRLIEFAEVGKIDQQKLKQLLTRIDSRLQHAGLELYQRNTLINNLQECFSPDSLATGVSERVMVEAFRVRLPGEMTHNESSLEAVIDEASLQKAEQLKKGSWVDLTTEEDFHKRCKLAGVVAPSGKYLFVNRQGGKEETLSRARVAMDIENHKLVTLDNSDLFDRALNKVIDDIRQRNKE